MVLIQQCFIRVVKGLLPHVPPRLSRSAGCRCTRSFHRGRPCGVLSASVQNAHAGLAIRKPRHINDLRSRPANPSRHRPTVGVDDLTLLSRRGGAGKIAEVLFSKHVMDSTGRQTDRRIGFGKCQSGTARETRIWDGTAQERGCHDARDLETTRRTPRPGLDRAVRSSLPPPRHTFCPP